MSDVGGGVFLHPCFIHPARDEGPLVVWVLLDAGWLFEHLVPCSQVVPGRLALVGSLLSLSHNLAVGALPHFPAGIRCAVVAEMYCYVFSSPGGCGWPGSPGSVCLWLLGSIIAASHDHFQKRKKQKTRKKEWQSSCINTLLPKQYCKFNTNKQ